MFQSRTPQTVIDTHNGTISNCILDIPQNIKVTLDNNVITTKAGSVLTYGGSVYTTQTITQDRATTISDTLANGFYFVNGSGNGTPILTEQSKFGSGDTLPEDGSTYERFYLTTSTDFWHWNSSQWVHSGLSYPLCMVEIVSGVASFAKDSNGRDMIFNGACFVGQYAVFYPNIKALIANGFNTDGSLKSTLIKTNSIQVVNISVSQEVFGIKSDNTIDAASYQSVPYLEVNEIPTTNIGSYVYNIKNNLSYRWFNSGGYYIQSDVVYLLDSIKSDTTVTDFTIRQPVRTATVEMLDKVQANINTVDAGAYHQPNEIVTLFDGNLGSGDIQLSDYFDSYEYLLFVYGNDDGNIMYSRMMTSYELETVLAISAGGPYALLMQSNGSGYWFIKKFADGSTTTLLKYSSDDDIKVYKVIGINRFD